MPDPLMQLVLLALLGLLLPMVAGRPLKAMLGQRAHASALTSSLSLMVSFLVLLPLLHFLHPGSQIPLLQLAALILLATALGLSEQIFRLPSQFTLLHRLLLATLCYLLGFGFHPSEGLAWHSWAGALLVDYPVTMLFYLGIMTTFSIIDRLHALATGVTMIMALALMGLVLHWSADLSPLLLGLIGTVCLGHLFLVQGDRRLKLGSAGQLQLALLLGTATVVSRSWGFTVPLLLFPLLAVVLPIFDRVYDGFHRLSHGPNGRGPEHLRSLLLNVGLSERWIVFLVWLITMEAGVMMNLLYEARSLPLMAVVILSHALVFLFGIACLIRMGDRLERKGDPGKLRILFLSHYFHPEVNAPATRLREHTRHWTAAGHQVTIVCPVPSAPHGRPYSGYTNAVWAEENFDGARVIRVWTFVAANRGRLRRSLNYFSYLVSALVALLFIRRHDVLVATTPQFFCGLAGALASLLRKEKFLLEVRDLWPESIEAVGVARRSLPIRALSTVADWMYRRADLVVTVGEGYRQRLVEPEGKLAPQQVVAIPNGIDAGLLAEGPPGLPRGGGFVVAYIGTLGLAHGLDVMVEAAELLRGRGDIRFLLVGDGAARCRLEREVHARGLENVEFAGLRTKEEVAEAFAMSSACLVHLRNHPLFRTVLPSKMFEAMGAARPVLLGVEGYSEAIIRESGGGIPFPPEDAGALARAVEQLAEDPTACREMGRRGRQYVERFFRRADFAREYIEWMRMVRDGRAVAAAGDGAGLEVRMAPSLPPTSPPPPLESPEC